MYAESYLIEVEYENESRFVYNVDPDKYSYLTLLQDVYKLFPEIKYDFPICVLGTGMHVETDADVDIMFTKYAENPEIHIMVYERLEPLQVVKQGETETNYFVAQILAAPLTEPEPEPQHQPDTEPEHGPQPEPEHGPQPEPQHEPQPEPHHEPENEPQLEPEPQPAPDMHNLPPVTPEPTQFIPEIHQPTVTQSEPYECGRDESDAPEPVSKARGKGKGRGKVGRPPANRSQRVTRSRQRQCRQKGRNNSDDEFENYTFSDSDDAEWLHDSAEPAISTSESESLDDEDDRGDVIMDDNDGLSDVGEECSDASCSTDDECSLRQKRKKRSIL